MDAGDRGDARDPAAGADDHLAVDRLAQDPVRAADVVGALGRDRRRLDPEPASRASPRRPRRRPRCRSRGGSPARGRSARARARARARSGSSTRSACSSSSCPVWSPSSATILSPAMRGRGYRPDERRALHLVRRRRSRPTTASAPTSRRASGARSSAGSSTSSPGRSRAPTGRPATLAEPPASTRPRRAARTATPSWATSTCCWSATAASTGSPTTSARSTTSPPGRRPAGAGSRRGRWSDAAADPQHPRASRLVHAHPDGPARTVPRGGFSRELPHRLHRRRQRSRPSSSRPSWTRASRSDGRFQRI